MGLSGPIGVLHILKFALLAYVFLICYTLYVSRYTPYVVLYICYMLYIIFMFYI